MYYIQRLYVLMILLCYQIIYSDCHVLQVHSVRNNFSLDLNEILKLGSNNAAPQEAPFQAQIRSQLLFEDSFICSAVWIGPSTLLTAAHCTNR